MYLASRLASGFKSFLSLDMYIIPFKSPLSHHNGLSQIKTSDRSLIMCILHIIQHYLIHVTSRYVTLYNDIQCFCVSIWKCLGPWLNALLMVGKGVRPAFRPPSLWASTQRTDLSKWCRVRRHDEAECQKMFGQNANPLDIFRHSNKTFYLILFDNLVVFFKFLCFFSCSSCSQSLSILFCFNVQSAKSPASPDWRFLPGEASGFCRCCKMLKALQRLQR